MNNSVDRVVVTAEVPIVKEEKSREDLYFRILQYRPIIFLVLPYEFLS